MKKLIGALVAVFAVYTGLWFYGWNQAKDYTDKKWDELVQKANERGYELTKKGSSLSGFPLGYKLEIQSPSLRAKSDANTVATHLDGTFIIKSNLLGNRYTVESSGDQHLFVPQANEQKHYILSGDLSLAFDLPNKNFLEGVNHPFKTLMEEQQKANSNTFVHNDSLLSVNNLKLVNADIPTLNIFEIEKGYLESDFDDRGADQRVTIDGDFQGFDMLLGGTDSYTPSEKRSLQDIAVMMSIPKAGKNNISFSVDFIGPIEALSQINAETSLIKGVPPFTVNINSLKTSNDFISSSSVGKFFAKERDNGGQKFHFNVKSSTEVSEKQESRLRDQWENFLNNLPICDGKFDSDICMSAKNIVPSWGKQGQLIYHMDIDYDLNDAVNPLNSSALVIKNLDLYSDLYGIKSHGDFIFKDPAAPKVTFLMELPNYQKLIKDLFSYFNGIRGLVPAIAPELRDMPPLNDEQLDHTISFFKSISDAPNDDKENIVITFQVNGWDKVTVGTLSVIEFITKTNQLMQHFTPEKTPPQQEALPETPTEKEILLERAQ